MSRGSCRPVGAGGPTGRWVAAELLPRRLETEQVARLLESCDRATVDGRRDLAILSLLARLGLRCCEVSGLCLDDIDWRAGEVTIRGKGSTTERLPLPHDVGEALVDYSA